MPASNAEVCAVKLFRALLVSTCAGVLVCGLASPSLALDGDFPSVSVLQNRCWTEEQKPTRRPDDPIISREIALSGFVEESFEDSLVRQGRRWLEPQAEGRSVVGLDQRQLDSGDKFLVRYEQAFAADGREIGAAASYRPKSRRPTGAGSPSTLPPDSRRRAAVARQRRIVAAPSMRLPLETVSVVIGFRRSRRSVRAAAARLGAPSRLGNVGATINTATARGIALGLGARPRQTASRGGRHVPDAQRDRSGRAKRHDGPGGGGAERSSVAAPNADTETGFASSTRRIWRRSTATSRRLHRASALELRSSGAGDGFVGNTGRSTRHLHFEVINNGQAIDPWPFRKRSGPGCRAPISSVRKLVRQSESGSAVISVGGAASLAGLGGTASS